MHLSPNCKTLETLITAFYILTVCNAAAERCLYRWSVTSAFYTKENNIWNSSAADKAVKSVFKTHKQEHTDFCWISLLKLEVIPLQNTSRVSCAICLHLQTEMRQLTPKQRNIFQLFLSTAHPTLTRTLPNVKPTSRATCKSIIGIGYWPASMKNRERKKQFCIPHQETILNQPVPN